MLLILSQNVETYPILTLAMLHNLDHSMDIWLSTVVKLNTDSKVLHTERAKWMDSGVTVLHNVGLL